jgi:RimJ/RimL family protein N-acetyltransferase
MIHPRPVTLEANGICLEPLSQQHHAGLQAAATDGELWRLWYTGVPAPEQVAEFIDKALAGQQAGHMLAWAIRDLASDSIIGTSRYHDIIADADRVEIGYTWYASRCQRTHVNTTCKLLLLEYAFEVLGCGVVGLRTDNFNFTSQRAIEALGAKRDGVIRHHVRRRDGSVRDSVMYSILLSEWPAVRTHLRFRLARHQPAAQG